MKRAVVVVLVCVLALSLAPAALAQDTAPQPVVRMGDWVEIGDDLFVNFIVPLRGSTKPPRIWILKATSRTAPPRPIASRPPVMSVRAITCGMKRVSVWTCMYKKNLKARRVV